MMNLKPTALPPPPVPNGSTPSVVKTCICNKSHTIEGCKFGDKCHFDQGECQVYFNLSVQPIHTTDFPQQWNEGIRRKKKHKKRKRGKGHWKYFLCWPKREKKEHRGRKEGINFKNNKLFHRRFNDKLVFWLNYTIDNIFSWHLSPHLPHQ